MTTIVQGSNYYSNQTVFLWLLLLQLCQSKSGNNNFYKRNNVNNNKCQERMTKDKKERILQSVIGFIST